MIPNKDNVDKIMLYLTLKGQDMSHIHTFITEPFYNKNGIGFYKEEMAYQPNGDYYYFTKDQYLLIVGKDKSLHSIYNCLYFFEAGSKFAKDKLDFYTDKKNFTKTILPLSKLKNYELLSFDTMYKVVVASESEINDMVRAEKLVSKDIVENLRDIEQPGKGALSDLTVLGDKPSATKLPHIDTIKAEVDQEYKEKVKAGISDHDRKVITSLYVGIIHSGRYDGFEDAMQKTLVAFQTLKSHIK
jgi:hypothetical protein